MRAKDKEVNPPLLLPCSRFCPPPLLSLSPSLLSLAPFLSLSPFLSPLSSPYFLLVVPLCFHFLEVSLGLHRRGKAEENRQGKEGERKKRERERAGGGAEAGTGEQKGRIHLLGLDARGSSFNSLSFSLSLFFLSLPLCFPSSRFVDSSFSSRGGSWTRCPAHGSHSSSSSLPPT